MINRYKTQSISVSEEEVEAIKRLAARLRLKPAAAARAFFYRGLLDFLNDGQVHAELTDDEIYERLITFLEKTPSARLKVPVTESEVNN